MLFSAKYKPNTICGKSSDFFFLFIAAEDKNTLLSYLNAQLELLVSRHVKQ